MKKYFKSILICVCLSLLLIPSAFADCEHEWQKTGETAAACTVDGTATYKCSKCEATKTEPISSSGHSWVKESEKAATCENEGSATYKCSKCSATKTEPIAAVGHTWSSWIYVVKPTQNKDGEQARRCTVCQKTETKVAPAVGAVPCEITKDPGGESVKEGDSCMFTAIADYYTSMSWRFVSRDGKTEVQVSEAAKTFPGLRVGVYTTTDGKEVIELYDIPASLSGWTVSCVFVGYDGKLAFSSGADIYVTPKPTPTPAPTPTPSPTPSPTPVPTATPAPTPTPVPENTPEPVPTPEPTPEITSAKTRSRLPFWAVVLIILVISLLALFAFALFIYPKLEEKLEDEKAFDEVLKKSKSEISVSSAVCCTGCGRKFKNPDNLPRFCPNCGTPTSKKSNKTKIKPEKRQ